MAENFVNIIRDIRGSTNDPAKDTSCIYGDIKSMHEEYKGFKQITDEERLKLENIEEGATKNSSDAFLLSRENHKGNMSIANVQDTPSRMAMTIHEKNKLEAIDAGATANDTDANLRNRSTHNGTQSIDTITDTSTHVKMSVAERGKLSAIAVGATKNATDAELRNRATHTGKQSADSIVDGLVNAAYTLQEKNKLSVLNTTVPPAHTHDNTSIVNLSYSKLINVPETFYPSEHLHSMNEITTGNLDASRINQTGSMQFVNSIEKEKITSSELMTNKGVPFGYAPLDGNGKINPSYLDALNVIDVFTPINQESMLLLTSAKPGDIAYIQDSQNTYMLVALPVHLQDNWKQMNSGSGVITFNGLNGVVRVGTDEIPEGSANIYFTNERVDDRVANLLTPGENVSIVYNDDTNQIIISANDTQVEWSEIQNKPNTKIDVNLSGEISGSGSVTLSQLGNGTLNIENITLENVGTAGTYRSVTTDIHGRVISGESATTIAEYEITDAYTKTEIENSLPSIGLDENNISAPIKVGQIKYNKADGTTNLMLENGFIHKAGLEQIKQVENSYPHMLEKGTVLVTDGKSGLTGNTSVYPCSGEPTDYSKIYGISAQDIAFGNTGYCYTSGKILNINTTGNSQGEMWSQGDVLYVKPNGNGALTNVEPVLGQLKVAIGFVEVVGINGTINIPGSAYVQYAVDEIKGSVDILDSTVVKLTGDQTIEDVKTFTSSPIVPTPTAVNQAVNKQYVDNMVISPNGSNSYAVAMAIVFGS